MYISFERKINFLFLKELRVLTEMSELPDRPFWKQNMYFLETFPTIHTADNTI